MEPDTVIVYVTAPDNACALDLARAAVESRLAACGNVLGQIRSVYWWNGKVNDEPEVALILKTRADLVAALTALIKDRHPYDCPCVVSLPIQGGNGDFLAWIQSETVPASPVTSAG